ncbi:MAG: hypothetical protein QM817_27085 [Archangium sp.]
MAQALGRAATIEELEQVRTEMQRLIIRSEVVSQDTYRLTTQLAELYERTDVRFDLVDERLDELKLRLDRVEQKVNQLEQKVDRLEQKVDRLEQKVDRLEQKVDRLEQKVDQLLALVLGLASSKA